MTETVFVHEKTYFELPKIHLSGFADCPRFHLYIHLSWAISLVSLFIWEMPILHQIDLKFSTHQRITACCLYNKVLASYDALRRDS